MSMFFNEIAEVNRVYCAAHGLPKPPSHQPRIDEMYAETTGATLAYGWLERCKVSEAEAFKVMTEIEITGHGDLIPKVLHLLSNISPYTNRDKIVNELAESLDMTLLACANNE